MNLNKVWRNWSIRAIQVELVFAASAPMTIDTFFPFKDNVKKLKENAVLVVNVGKTERILSQWISKHKKQNSSACRLSNERYITYSKLKLILNK